LPQFCPFFAGRYAPYYVNEGDHRNGWSGVDRPIHSACCWFLESPRSVEEEKNKMMTHGFHALKILTAAVVLALGVANAQSRIVASVPFDFEVANRYMERGEYTFTIDLSRATVLVQGHGNDSAAFALSHSTQAGKIDQDAKLIFNRYGDRYFLSQVRSAGMADGRELQQSRKERELLDTSSTKPAIVALIVKARGVAKAAP